MVPRLVRSGHEVVGISRGERDPYVSGPEWSFVEMIAADREAEDAAGMFGDWLAGKPMSFILTLAWLGYLVFGFLGCWTVVRVAGKVDRKHTLSVLYNLVKEHKDRNSQ